MEKGTKDEKLFFPSRIRKFPGGKKELPKKIFFPPKEKPQIRRS
jgi:hypothetical protein